MDNSTKNTTFNSESSLFDRVASIFEKYLDKKKIQEFLKEEQNWNFGYYYWFWFKATNVLNITENDLKEDFSYSQKLGLKIVIIISLIESLYGEKFGENTIIDFFSKLNIEEKILFNLIVDIEDSTEDVEVELFLESEDAIQDHHQLMELKRRLKLNLLLYYLFYHRLDLITQEFNKRIKYLYALRSQIVHRGNLPITTAILKPFPEVIKIAFVSPFPKKGVEKKVLSFQDYKYGIKFEDILEDLVFISFLRNKNIKISKKFSEEFKEKFLRILKEIQAHSYKDVYFFIRQKLNQYLAKKNSKNITK
jgi:hypothetical protein